MSAAKATSVLRDDIRGYIQALESLYSGKNAHLERLQLSESDKKHYIGTADIDRIEDIQESEAFIMNTVDLMDFDISEKEHVLSGALGIERDRLYAFLSTVKDNDVKALILMRVKLRDTAEKLLEMQCVTSRSIHAMLVRTKKSIEELRRIGTLTLKNGPPEG